MAIFLKGGFAVTVMLQLLTICTAQYKLVCLYTSTSPDWFNIDKIDPHLCTHIIYGSFIITRDGYVDLIFLNFAIRYSQEKIQKFIDLKKENPKLKLLAQFNGNLSEVSGDPNKRKILSASVKNFTVTYGFDGITLDSEFLAPMIATSAEKENFVNLLRDLKEEFHEDELLLTAHVYSPRENYNISEIMKYLDFANLIIFNQQQNFHFTSHIAPLFSSSLDDQSSQKLQIVNDSISYWLNEGAPAEKLLMGLPFFEKTFKLSDESVNGMRALTKGSGAFGPHLQFTDIYNQSDFCDKLLTDNWTLQWDNEQKVPFAYKGVDWIAYENLRSILHKTQYIKDHKLGGMMVWSLDLDDFLGTCGEKYPLLKMVNANLLADSDPECEPFIDVTQRTHICAQTDLRPEQECKIFYKCDNGRKFIFQIQ